MVGAQCVAGNVSAAGCGGRHQAKGLGGGAAVTMPPEATQKDEKYINASEEC